ncbi:hypothetical protein E7744_09380 [Citricoccus sp. SGAir0253]|uniref:hypothetical protein n=1 Tax=Citricoccus sp. SGAir0253 TaxID=2567881 RepID=UPI0010CD1FFA|nr:hypothetical protein [Citricoccus sp. SGAir0253]QCU78352.1 hypothetical protein E7744_09380 [Citricoccus sp. SGAir0253]
MPSSVTRLPRNAVGTLGRKLRSGSRLGQATFLAVVLGTVLVALQAVLSGLWLAAAGICLLGAAASVLALKVFTAALLAARTERSLRQGMSAAPPARAPSRPVAAADPATANRLRAIGVVEPSVVNAAAKGRQAAAVRDDPQRSFRLYAATRGASLPADQSSAGAADGAGRRRIAAIATAEQAAAWGREFAVTRLHPELARAEFEAAQPTALVIHEDALRTGAWYSTLQAGGVGLLRQVFDLIATCRRNAIMVYVVASDTLELSTPTLRRRATLVVRPGEDDDALPGTAAHGADVDRPLIRALRSRRVPGPVGVSTGATAPHGPTDHHKEEVSS